MSDWRCRDCDCLNRDHEAFCFRCGAGRPETPDDPPRYVFTRHFVQVDWDGTVTTHLDP